MTYSPSSRNTLRKRLANNFDPAQPAQEFVQDSTVSVHLHLNTRLNYVLGPSRAAQHRRISNVIHRYGLLLGDSIPKLREQFNDLELAIIAWAIADSNPEHMNSRTFIGLMKNMVAQRRQEGLLRNVAEEELDTLEDKLTDMDLLEELSLLDLVEQRLAKGHGQNMG